MVVSLAPESESRACRQEDLSPWLTIPRTRLDELMGGAESRSLATPRYAMRCHCFSRRRKRALQAAAYSAASLDSDKQPRT